MQVVEKDSLDKVGAQHHPRLLASAEIKLLSDLASRHLGQNPGKRIVGDALLSSMLANNGALSTLAKNKLGDNAKPVRAVFFDKHQGLNWSLGWHQDRTIVVRNQCDRPGFGPWTVKDGLNHVEPPFEYIEQMVTLRAHLDDCDECNAPLLISPGSHKLGRIPEKEICDVVQRLGSCPCLAEIGDVWIYSAAILHASNSAVKPRRRRVLQVDFSTAGLPDGLDWLGI